MADSPVRHSRESGDPQVLITEHLDIWTSAIKTKSTAGRGSSKKLELVGVKKLRELILALAVRGKLVPQDPNDEPVSELLKKIEVEKAKLVKEGKIKKQKPLPTFSDGEIKIQVPLGWVCKKLPDIYYPISPSGKKLKTSEIQNQGLHPVVDQGQEYISGYSNDDELLIKLPSPVIVFGDHTRNIKYIDFDFIAGADGTKILCPILIYPRYFYLYLNSYDLESRGYGRHFKILNDNLFFIPPEAEQHRIVAKIDELMVLCDQLETQTESSIQAHQVLVETLLATLSNAKDADELNNNWQMISQHFDVLFTTQDAISQLQQTILQLAVMGKLVKQDPNDEPIENLVEKLYQEHCERKLNNKDNLVIQNEYEKAKVNITNNKVLIKARFICDFITKGTTPSKPELLERGAIPFLKVYNIVKNKLDFAYKPIFISAQTHTGILNRSRVFPGDVIMNIVGPPLGKVAVITDEYPEWNMNQALAVFRPLGGINSQYLYYMLPTDLVLASVLKEVKGTAGQDNLSLEQCRDLLIPIPSIKQQQLTVELIEILFNLCESLKAKLNQAQTTQLHLTDAIVEQVL
ncbi:restriction endonuclease subunit S [Paraglaciecola sp. 25GB23A]|uniref:restriction endonuclease subunit S n=1 Tax=Paraglaciecola sp. 25GB23A TaxID=3156068 RepID=UPI0032AFBCE1